MNGSSLTIHPPETTQEALTAFRDLLNSADEQQHIAMLEPAIVVLKQHSDLSAYAEYWLLVEMSQQLMTPGRNRGITGRASRRASYCVDYNIALELKHLKLRHGLFERCAGRSTTWTGTQQLGLYFHEARQASRRISLLHEEVC